MAGYRGSTRERGRLSNYYETDGLAGNAFEGFPAAYRSQRGQMFFGNTSGLTSFWPEEIVEKPFIPPVVLTGLSLRNQPVAPRPGSLLAKSITFTPSLTLSHEQNLFSFEFAALSFVDPERNQYRYMLEGLDHSWNPSGPQTPAGYLYVIAHGRLYTARSGIEQSRSVERAGGCPAPADPSSLVGHMVVSRCLRGCFCAPAVGSLGVPCRSPSAGIQHAPGGARRRTDAHRA